MEKWIAVFVQLGMILLLSAFGVLFSRGKGAFLIAGYNTASPEEKRAYDEKALCRFMGKTMFVLAAFFAMIVLGTVLDWMILVWCGIFLMMGTVIWAAVYANTGNRFRKRK